MMMSGRDCELDAEIMWTVVGTGSDGPVSSSSEAASGRVEVEKELKRAEEAMSMDKRCEGGCGKVRAGSDDAHVSTSAPASASDVAKIAMS